MLHSLSTALSFLCTVQCFAPFALRTLCSPQSVFCFSIPSFLFIRTLPLVRESDPFCPDTGSSNCNCKFQNSELQKYNYQAPPYQSPRTYRTNLLPSPPAKPQLTKLQPCKLTNLSSAKYQPCKPSNPHVCRPKPRLAKLQTYKICNKSANPVSDAGSPVRITASEESHLALKHKYSVMHLLYTARIFLSIHTVSHIHDC